MKTRGKESRSRRWRAVRTARRAGAVVEMAVVTPLLLTMLLGMIEFGWVFMVEQTLTNGAREACRMASLPGTTDTEIQTRFQEAVAATGLTITPDMLTIVHATTDNPVVTIRVAVPYSQVTLLGILPSSLFRSGPAIGDKTVGSVCSMRKEGAI